MNAPSRFELYVLSEGEPKLSVAEDTKIPNAATITINKEDHTLANMIKAQLEQLSYVIFSGYRVPHPLEPRCVLKVQTNGERTPIEAVQEACTNAVAILGDMKQAFTKEVARAKARGEADGPGGEDDEYNFES